MLTVDALSFAGRKRGEAGRGPEGPSVLGFNEGAGWRYAGMRNPLRSYGFRSYEGSPA